MSAPAGRDAEPLPADLAGYHAAARRQLPLPVYDYCAGGAGRERTVRENRRAFSRRRFRPRVLVDVSRVDPGMDLFGIRLKAPILLAPAGFNRLFHVEGEHAAARAADAAGTIMVTSTMASVALETTATAAAALWFQLYVLRDRGLTRALIARAEAAGYRALVLTVDAPTIGRRLRDVRNGFVLPEDISAANLSGGAARWTGESSFTKFNGDLLEPALTWADVEWVRGATRLPLLVKGVMAATDAVRAIAAGVDGVIVSNHGGRQLDGEMASLDALPDIADQVAGRVPLLLDGGIRSGGDVLTALALGARAVLIGRPYLWGLAVGGEAGVRGVLDLLRDELVSAMALTGCRDPASITAAILG